MLYEQLKRWPSIQNNFVDTLRLSSNLVIGSTLITLAELNTVERGDVIFLDRDGIINVEIFDLKGSFMKTIALQKVKKGLNELNFSTEPLANGSYYVRVIDGSNKVLAKEKFIKK